MATTRTTSKNESAKVSAELHEEIKQKLKNSIRKYVSDFKYRSIQPLDFLIPKERKIRSVVGGLETSMGTTVWEPIAKTLAQNNGFEVLDKKILCPSPMPKSLSDELGNLIRLRENMNTWVSIKECKKRLRNVCEKINKSGLEFVPPAAGTGVDVYFKKGSTEYAFDIKTVQPNVGNIKSFNKQILEWYAYRICKNSDVSIECKIAYPYNPYSNDFWNHVPHKGGSLEPGVDAVVEDQFWDFLSGLDNSYKLITSILKELNEEGFGKELSGLIENIYSPID